MISVRSLCQTASALSITVAGIASPLLVLAVKITCHIPTIDLPSSRRNRSSSAVRTNRAAPYWGCHAAGFTVFGGIPHCPHAAVTVEIARADSPSVIHNFNLEIFKFITSPLPGSPTATEKNRTRQNWQCRSGKAGGEALVKRQVLDRLIFRNQLMFRDL